MPASSKMPNFSGSTINGRYKLLQLIGSGAYGVVYKALDILASNADSDRFRAIKLVCKAGRKPTQLDSIRREISIHLHVSSHPNVVTLHEAYEDELYFIFVLDYCGGGDLSNYLEKHGRLTSDMKLREMFLAIVDAAEYLHAQGIYHRDLKPGNILLSEDGSQVYLADFGMASQLKLSHSRCGTPSYMSPELLKAAKTTGFSAAACDVWALGVILLNMLTGRMPWRRALLSNPHYAAFFDDQYFIMSLIPISLGVNKIARRMLRANPKIRSSLPDARRAIAELDSFFRDGEMMLPEYLNSCGEPINTDDIYHLRSTMQSEIDIQNCWVPRAGARQVLDCSAGFVSSTRTDSGSKRTTVTVTSSTLVPSAQSSEKSGVVIPREDVVVKDAGGKRTGNSNSLFRG